MPEHHQKVALIRFAVVSVVLSRVEAGMSFAAALRSVTKSPPITERGEKFRFSERTLRRWVGDYKRIGFNGLLPVDRRMTSASRVLKNDFISYICREKITDQDASIPELMRRAKEDEVDIGTNSRVTVWRAAKKLNLPIFSAKAPENSSKRRFAYEYPMQMVLTDGVHFRAGPKRAKRVAMILLDDASRYAFCGVVGYSENTELFLKLIWMGLTRHGHFSNLFVDNGSGFSSGDAGLIFARLGIPLIHGTVDYPEGRGKIERFNRTVRADHLRGFDGFGDSSIGYLQLQLNHYLEHEVTPPPYCYSALTLSLMSIRRSFRIKVPVSAPESIR